MEVEDFYKQCEGLEPEVSQLEREVRSKGEEVEHLAENLETKRVMQEAEAFIRCKEGVHELKHFYWET